MDKWPLKRALFFMNTEQNAQNCDFSKVTMKSRISAFS